MENAEEACEVLRRGYASRHIASTAMNSTSSRSHAVFTMVIDTAVQFLPEQQGEWEHRYQRSWVVIFVVFILSPGDMRVNVRGRAHALPVAGLIPWTRRLRKAGAVFLSASDFR